MDKNTISFMVLCVLVVISVLEMYTYNKKQFETQSTMVVVPIEDTSNSQTEYLISEQSTSVSIITTKDTTSTTTTKDVNITTSKVPETSLTTVLTTTTKKISTTKEKNKSTEKVVNFPISLNSATYDELICISGIGDVTAQKIIDYRNSLGGYFTSRYQLLDINGIGEKKMNTIMEYTYIENENLEYGQEDVIEVTEVIENPIDETSQDILEDIPLNNESDIQVIETTIEFPINLNTATLEELCYIPNVDETIAQDIISLREQIQYFSNPYELLYAESISESFLSQIIDYVSVE